MSAGLARQTKSYLEWIAKSFRPRWEWPWVDSARALLDRGLSPANSHNGALEFAGASDRSHQEELELEPELSIPEPSTGAYAAILKRCAERRDLHAGKLVHAHAVASGYARDSFVENSLIQMYGKCRRVDLARSVFDAMARRDLFSWNIIISAYAQNGHPWKALEIFEAMEALGVAPDAFVAASVMGAYARCGLLDRARAIFDAMEGQRDPGSWSAMVSACVREGDPAAAVELYSRMNLEGVEPNRLTYVSVLAALGSLRDLDRGRSLYARFLARGFAPDLVIQSALLSLLAKCGSLDEARRQFAQIRESERDVTAWTSMIEACARHGRCRDAVALHRAMNLEGLASDAIAFVAVLGACAAAGSAAASIGKSIHALLRSAGLENHTKVETALLIMYAKCGSPDDAKRAFDRIHSKDVIAWNAMLRALARYERHAEALDLFLAMDAAPDAITFGSLLSACCCAGALDHGRAIHRRLNLAAAAGVIKLDVEMFVLLLAMYSKCGSIQEARAVFDRMPARNLVAWNAMAMWYARYAIAREALEIFREMVALEDLALDVVSCIAALAASAQLGDLAEGRRIHARIADLRLRRDVVLWTTLINMYAKCGQIAEARSAFEEMEERNTVAFNAMLAAYAQIGHIDRAIALYRRMICEEGLDADHVTLLGLLVACNHAGLHRQGRDLFVQLRGDHEWIEPVVDHYHCLVDLLSRAGRLEDAEEILARMPFQPGAIGWKSLLNGCGVHGDPVRGARAAAMASALDPVDSSHYVLLSNAYAWHEMEEEVREAIDLTIQIQL